LKNYYYSFTFANVAMHDDSRALFRLQVF